MTACDTAAQQGADPVRRRLAVARGDEPADLVLKGGRVLSVFTGEVFEADVAICGEHIAGLGSYHAPRETDVRGHVLVPGLLDAHMHLESTKLMVDQFARAVLPHGTTTVFIDPHEVANVFGLRGVRALLESASAVPLDYYVLVPSCVPAEPVRGERRHRDRRGDRRVPARAGRRHRAGGGDGLPGRGRR